jgi:xylulokinase
MALALGLDVGTSSTKAVAVEVSTGVIVAAATQEYPLSTPRPGWAQQDPALWVKATREVLTALTGHLGPRASEVVSIGLSGQMHSAVVLDEALAPVHPALLWCDTRTSSECAEIEAVVGRDGLARLVGNAALEGFTLPKLLWLRRHEPAAFARIRHVVMPKDYVAWALTGELGTEVSDASGTLAFSPRERAWSVPLLDAVGIDPRLFPAVAESSDVRGRLSPSVAAAVGLPATTIVACGAADNAAAAVGLGAIREGTGLVSIGTSGVVLLPTAKLRVDPTLRLHAFRGAVPGDGYVMGVMLAAGLALRFYRDTFGGAEIAEAASRGAGVDPYTVLAEAAERSRPGANGLVFLPYLMGERTPHADARARGAFVGLTARTTRDDLVRAVMEGIVFGLADCLACRESLDLPVALDRLRITGGGARSPLFCQLVADVLGVPVETAANPEGAALGAALLGAVAAGVFPTVAAATDVAVAVDRTWEPDAAKTPFYAEMLSVYRELYQASKASVHRLGGLAELSRNG